MLPEREGGALPTGIGGLSEYGGIPQKRGAHSSPDLSRGSPAKAGEISQDELEEIVISKMASTEYSPTHDLNLMASFRFEGNSDSDDIARALVLKANDETGGVFTDALGVRGDSKAADFDGHIPDRLRDSETMAHVPRDKEIEVVDQSDDLHIAAK